MLRNKIYYAAKPFLPWGLRYFTRRIFARRLRMAHQSIWPIDESAGSTPAAWPGWPDGKKFAFVITHDVEGPDGLENCRRLAELEIDLGFRSTFNFVPEGGYTVPPDLRDWLCRHGFEVGIHDLHHDGKLFNSSFGFEAKAKKINDYIHNWNAAGFRAGFMMHNLQWNHCLDISYDSSTFDTDPFEPMPDGVGTIFPFWVDAPLKPVSGRPSRKRGYVELPYTLPQDSTLFFLLGESGPEIWLRKLDWIAEHGGMALLNVHPDYVRFEKDKPRSSTYPVSFYLDILRHVKSRIESDCWHVVSRDLATWYEQARPVPCPSEPTPESRAVTAQPTHRRLEGKKAAVLLYSTYPADPRPRRAAEAMVEAGMEVDLFCLSQSDNDAAEETINGVRVFRHPMKRRRDSTWSYLLQYTRFYCSSFWFLAWRSLRVRYDLVHVHNMPDFLVFAALAPKLRGAKIVLDLHDPSPELMITIFGLPHHHWSVRLLRSVERWSIAFSTLVLTPNIAFKKLFSSRSCAAEKVAIVMNSPEPTIFAAPVEGCDMDWHEHNGEFRVMHHGLIAHRHGVDLLVEAVAQLRPKIPGIHLDIYGGPTPFLPTVLKRAHDLGISDIVHHHGARTQTEIAAAIRRCHVGVVPNRCSVFTEINFPTRLFEYLAMQRPVVAPNTQGIRDYFGPDDILLFEPDDVADLASKILLSHEQPRLMREYVVHGAAVYRSHLWLSQKSRLIDAIASVLRVQTGNSLSGP